MASTFTAFPDESEFLDALPLRGLGEEGLDDFDAFLDDNYDDRFLANSQGSVAMDRIFADSQGSATMDCEFECLSKSMENVTLDFIDEVGEQPQQRKSQQNGDRRARSVRGRSPSPPRRRFHIQNNINFDPTPLPYDCSSSARDDVSMCSFNTAQTDASCFSISPGTQARYNESLERLAQSMKRTEESRRQVLMQRELLLKSAADESMMRRASAMAPSVRPLSPGRSSIMTAFFSGSRGTLTNGLEHSRRQLRMYMNQINNQSL